MVAAVSNSNPEVVSALLKGGADAKLKRNDGKNALSLAGGNEKLKGAAAYWALNDATY
jgi:hypothetical protein